MDNPLIKEEKIKIYRALNDLVYAGIHDLKSPIANLKLIARLLESVEHLDEVKEYANMAASALVQMETSVNGLATVMDIESNDSSAVETINFSRLAALLKTKYPAINLIENFNVPEIKHVPVYVRTLLDNIISNSLNFNEGKGNITLELTTHREEDYILLTAKDNGKGINLDKYGNNLFNPFTKINSKGAGVGLYLIKIIAEKNGGKVQIESEPGAGTVLKIYLREY